MDHSLNTEPVAALASYLIKRTLRLFNQHNGYKVIGIPQGQLSIFLSSLEFEYSFSQLIFQSVTAWLRRDRPYSCDYHLVIQQGYEKNGEETTENLNVLEKQGMLLKFSLDKSLHFRTEVNADGNNVLTWKDLRGDEDMYEFVCDSSTKRHKVPMFQIAAMACQYEKKYRKSAGVATEHELKEFHFDKDTTVAAINLKAETICSVTAAEGGASTYPDLAVTRSAGSTRATRNSDLGTEIVLVRIPAELWIFSFKDIVFILLDDAVLSTIYDLSDWSYRLQVDSKEKNWLRRPVFADMHPTFSYEYLSFLFYYVEDGVTECYLLRFKDHDSLKGFKEDLQTSLWEHLHQTKWEKNARGQGLLDTQVHFLDGNAYRNLTPGLDIDLFTNGLRHLFSLGAVTCCLAPWGLTS
jgi:hypothetical protein